MKLHLKFIENCTERKFLTPMKQGFALANISQRHGGWVSQKELTILQFSVKLPQLQSFPDAIWWKTNCLTVSILNLRGLGTVQVLPASTPSMVLGTYATISLWSISTTCTGYPCRNKVIPLKQLFVPKGREFLSRNFLCNFENLLAPEANLAPWSHKIPR